MPTTHRKGRALLRAGALALTLTAVGLAAGNVRAEDDKKETDARILFVSDRDMSGEFAIYAMNPDGSGQTRISKGKGIAFDPAWSPDHKQIIYAFFTDKKMLKSDLMVMKADGSGPTRLISSDEKSVFLSPAWAPDGKHIVFYRVVVGDKIDTSIYVMDADGKNKKKLGEGITPVWSPDSKHILFSSTLDNIGPPEIKIMDADGTHARILAKGLGACYSSDGKRIVFICDSEGSPSIFVMDADGSHSHRLTKEPEAMTFGPVWTPDGKHILYTRFPKDMGGGKPKFVIHQMDADGSNEKELKIDAVLGVGPSLFFLLMNYVN